MTTFVGIHGSWFGGWYWSDVARIVEAEGHRTALVDQLPSGGTDPLELGDLTEDAAFVRDYLDDLGEPVVLAGHSYSGMVLAEVADYPAVEHSILISAFWPRRGQAALDLAGDGPLPDWMEVSDHGGVRLSRDPETVREALFAEIPPDRARKLYEQMSNQLMSLAALQTPSTAPPRSHQATYVICEKDRATPPLAQEAMSQRAERVVRLPTSHCPMLAAPEALASVVSSTLDGHG